MATCITGNWMMMMMMMMMVIPNLYEWQMIEHHQTLITVDFLSEPYKTRGEDWGFPLGYPPVRIP